MATIGEDVRKNLVSDTYLHSNKFNFYNAAMGGATYSQLLNNLDNNKVLQNMEKIKKRLLTISQNMKDKEREFFRLVECSGPEEFTTRYLQRSSFNQEVVQNANSPAEVVDAIIREVGIRINEDQKFMFYLLGYDIKEVANYIIDELRNTRLFNEQDLGDFAREIVQNGLSNDLFKKIQDTSGMGRKPLVELSKSLGIKANERLTGNYSSSSLYRLQNRLIDKFTVVAKNAQNKNNKKNKKTKKNTPQYNLFVQKVRELARSIIKEYKIRDRDNKILNKVMNYYLTQGMRVLGETSRDVFLQPILYPARANAIGGQGEIARAGLGVIHIPGVQIDWTPAGSIRAPKTLLQRDTFLGEQDKDLKNQGLISKTENGNVYKYFQYKTFYGEIRQDGVVRIIKDNVTYYFGFQIKNTHLDKATIHLQSSIYLTRLLGTMEFYQMIDDEMKDEILYILTNYFYFKENPDVEDNNKIKVQRDNNHSRSTADNSVLMRYISILLQAGIEMVIEPQISEYTEKRMEEINADRKNKIVGNTFYIIHNTLVPISYFFDVIFMLINDYQDLIKNRKYQTTYFSMKPFTIKGFEQVPSNEMREEKNNVLATLPNANGEFNYPDSLRAVGSKYGQPFLRNSQLGGYDLFVQLDELENAVFNMKYSSNNLGGK